MIALFEKKLPFKQTVVDITSGENYKPLFLDINPRGEVPVLKDGVKIIPDSSRIIDYLEDNFSNGWYFVYCLTIFICVKVVIKNLSYAYTFQVTIQN